MKLISYGLSVILIELLAISAFAFNITMTWDVPPGSTTNDITTTNVTKLADITAVNVYRGTTLTNFVLYQVLPPTTNVATFQNLPNEVSYMFIRFKNASGEGGPSSTNQIFPPGNPPNGNKFSKQ